MIIKEIRNRRSIRKYKSAPVSDRDILEIIKAAQFAPTAKHNSAIEFIVIREQTTKDKITGILGQEFLRRAPVLIALATNPDETVAPVQDLSIASENIFLQATKLGLGTVWKNIHSAEQAEEIKKILGIPKKFIMINIVPLGYPDENIPPHSESDFDKQKIHNEKW